jgi:hypothetical protein
MLSSDTPYESEKIKERTMRIMDYETNRNLNDVAVFLTLDEAEELLSYLRRLNDAPAIQRIHLSEFSNDRLEREITVSLTDRKISLA